MFSPDIWARDPFRRVSFTSHVSLPSYNYASPNIEPYTTRPARRHHQHRRRSVFAMDVEGSEFTEDSDRDERYYLDNESNLNAHLRSPYSPELECGIGSFFDRVSVKMPTRSIDKLNLDRDEILILPPTLTHLIVQIRSDRSNDTVRAAVAGDMRLRDMVKQLVPERHTGEVRACVKLRGEWQEPGPNIKMSDIADAGRFAMNEQREVEVKIVIGGLGGTAVGMRAAKGWERETGRGWEWRG